MNGPPPEIIGIWLHSHEEDTESTTIFRPRHYNFPRTRWRDALELIPDGTCIWHGSGPDDRGQAIPGRWEDLENGRAQITIPTPGGQPSRRRIQTWAPDKLILEKEH